MILTIFLLPLVAAVPLKTTSNYIYEIENGILKNVQLVGEADRVLDLSNMGLLNLEKTAFDGVRDLISLNLANNSLSKVPDFVFSNLTELQHLSLAQNKMTDVKYLFVGLETLRTVNISYNPIPHLRRGHLFGLTKAASIYTEGNVFWSISTGVFENSFLKDEEEIREIEAAKESESPMLRSEQEEKKLDTLAQDSKAAAILQGADKKSKVLSKDLRLKLCMADGIVVSLDIIKSDDSLGICSEVTVDTEENKVSLRDMGIKGFQENWYKLQSIPIASIDLSHNDIVEITRETLNDLPADLVYVNFLENRIRKIWRNVIDNRHLRMLNFKGNHIEEIEEGAFEKTNLTGLYISGNQLDDLKFALTLPPSLTEFVFTNNPLRSIPDAAFSRLSKLVYLNLANNRLEKLQRNAFKGLDSLQVLILARNNINEIEPEAFSGLPYLRTLYIYRNSIDDLKKGTFDNLESLKDLNIAWNKLARISKDMFTDLPKSLDFLHLDYNEIEFIEEGSFAEVPRFTLSLNGNRISSIPRGAFDLPSLQDLYLNNNTLTTIEGDAYEGLPRLRRLWLSQNRIAQIQKGSCKNLASLYILDISRNPLQRLENGALHGLRTIAGTFVYIYENQLKLMQGGLFDDV